MLIGARVMRSIFLIRQLEQRWMFDGAAVGDVVEATIVTDNDSDDSPVIAAYDNQTSPEQVVFIDGAIGDIFDKLLSLVPR